MEIEYSKFNIQFLGAFHETGEHKSTQCGYYFAMWRPPHTGTSQRNLYFLVELQSLRFNIQNTFDTMCFDYQFYFKNGNFQS